MTANTDTLGPLIDLAVGRTVGGEPMFIRPQIREALLRCTALDIAVVGLELFSMCSNGYRTEALSSYEIQVGGLPWHDFVSRNNELAAVFVSQNPSAGDQFYLLTALTHQKYQNCSS